MRLDLLMAGVSSSGKTTFLAALYEFVRAAVPGAVRLREEPEDKEYFFEISQAWLRFQELGHSNIGAPRNTLLPLVTPDGQEFDLRIPDIVGESFAGAWEGKDWPADVVQIAQESDGLLLFAHGAHVEPPIKLPPGEDASSNRDAENGAPPWDPSGAPTQTVLADLLEGFRDISPKPAPTAIVVSAWDRVLSKTEMTPATWLRTGLPLLWQMLEGRGETFPYEVFGISAQGGDVTDEEQRARLAEVKPQYKRILVQQGDQASNDIVAPISWLLSQVQ
jgi:hypothetical protein